MGFLSLIAKLGLDTSGFESGIKRSESLTKKFSGNLNSSIKGQILGAVSIGAIVAATKTAIDYASHITDISTQLGIGTEKLQEYAFAAKQTGGSLDDFAGVAGKLAKSRSEAVKDPTGEVAKGFAKLGVSAQELKTLRLDGIIDKIGVAFKNARDPQELLSAGFATMGKGALPVIGAMREGLDEYAEMARKAGLIVSEETTAKLDDMGDALDRLKQSFISTTADGIGYFITKLTEAWRLIKSTTAGAAAYWGARSAGATDKDASKIARDTYQGEIAKDVSSDQAMASIKEKRKKFSALAVGDFDEDPKKSKSSVQEKSNLNSLQQIGAYSGANPLLKGIDESNRALQAIKVASMTTARNTSTSRVTTDSF